MDHWNDHPVPPMRHVALHGDRLVRCFVDRPAGLHAMFAAALARRPRCRCAGVRWPALELLGMRARHRLTGRAPGRRRRAARRPHRAADRQPSGIRDRAAGAAAARSDRGAGRGARAQARPDLHRASMRRDRHRARRRTGGPASRRRRCTGAAAVPGGGRRQCHGTRRCDLDRRPARGAGRRRAGTGRGRRDRCGGDPLHLGNHRQPEGRDADAAQHRPLGAPLRGLPAPAIPTTAPRWRSRPAT